MRLRDLIKIKKTITALGKWQVGKMPRSAFPLSKSGNRAYRLGNRRWRVVEFTVESLCFRLLINYNPLLLQYQAMLGLTQGNDTKVLASLEYHGTHGSWHVHTSCDIFDSIPAGIKRGPWITRLPSPKNYNRAGIFVIGDDAAFTRAIDFFGLDKTADSTTDAPRFPL